MAGMQALQALQEQKPVTKKPELIETPLSQQANRYSDQLSEI